MTNAENNNPTTENQDLTPASSRAPRARNGKIARLPASIREELNRRLMNGEPGPKLLEWLNSQVCVNVVMEAEFNGRAITKHSLSHWRRGGYKEYVEDQKIPTAVKMIQEKIGNVQAVARGSLADQVAFQMVVKLALQLDRLEAAPDGAAATRMWREVRTSLVALRRGDLDLQKLRLQQEKFGLAQKSQEEREAEFWKWADENINRDEFCRRRCFTPEERRAAINKILGLTPQERGETVNSDSLTPCGQNCPSQSQPVAVSPSQSE